MKHTLPLSLLSVALLSQLNATENQYTLQNISVTASQGTTLEKRDVTDSVTIITKEAIEESRVTTLAEALSQLGNVAINQSGGLGQQTSLFMRGMETRRLLILIDGVRYNNPTTPGAIAEIAEIMLYNVERIEIIKGSQSGVWGSDASGGVINIVTSKAKEGTYAALNVEYGSFDTKKTSLQASYAAEEFDVLIGGLYLDADSFSAYEPAFGDQNYGKRYDELGLEKDAYKNSSFNTKLGYNLTKIDRIEANIGLIDSNVDFDAYRADGLEQNTKLKNNFYNINYQHKGQIHEINTQYNLSTFDRESQFSSSFTGEYKGSIDEVKIDDKIVYAQESFIRIGASYQLFNYEKQTGSEDKNYDAVAAFATNYNKLELLKEHNTIITESLRYDKYSDFEDALTGKLGLKQFVHKDIYLSTNLGSGFNAPTIGQVFGEYGAVANPNLKPENSLTYDITLGTQNFWEHFFTMK